MPTLRQTSNRRTRKPSSVVTKLKASSNGIRKRATTKKRSSGKKRSSRKNTRKTTLKSKNPSQKQPPIKVSKKLLLQAYRDMALARLADEKSIVLYKQNKCFFQIGCAGHEAVQVAAGHAFRSGQDWFYPYYRDMALCSALGMTAREFMLNTMSKEADPSSHGRQMPMHYGHKDLNIVNQSSPTGTQFLQAVGCALALKKKGIDEVVYVSAGEGTCSQGDYHEALNWAAREKLPVIFLIQNNDYAISVPIWEQIAGESVYKISEGYENLDRYRIDGTDFIESLSTFQKAHRRALSGKGPSMIEALVPRLQSHSISDNHLKYRTEEDIENEQKRCPVKKFESLLIKKKILSKSEIEDIKREIKAEIDQAAEWAEQQPDPDPSRATDRVYKNPTPWAGVQENNPSGEETYLVDAINHALHEEMKHNDDVYVFGQDVAHGKGGVFTVTTGLTDAFGVERAFNAPLAESSIIGVSVGMATRGLKPVAEIQFGDYIWTGMMQLRNELAMMYYRSDGDFSCPAVIRVAVGGYIRGACYHSQNIEATFSHFPGVFVVYPSNATDAKGLLKAAIRCEDPVLFLEHKGLYRQVYAKGAEGGIDDLVPIGKAKKVREGSDLTIVTWGALVQKSILTANELEKEGYSVEVIDLRTIAPLDIETIYESVRKTNRVLVAHEDVEFVGFGAEIVAGIADQCFEHLDAPVKRVGMKNVAAVPQHPVLENAILPQTEDVLFAARQILAF